jgi:hypothetical protein
VAQGAGRRETAGKARAVGRPKPSAIADPRAERFGGELYGGHRANSSRRSATGAACSPNPAALRARSAGIPAKNEVITNCADFFRRHHRITACPPRQSRTSYSQRARAIVSPRRRVPSDIADPGRPAAQRERRGEGKVTVSEGCDHRDAVAWGISRDNVVN